MRTPSGCCLQHPEGVCFRNAFRRNATKNGSKGARTPDLSRVRRTLIPAELCFHALYYITCTEKINRVSGNRQSFQNYVSKDDIGYDKDICTTSY